MPPLLIRLLFFAGVLASAAAAQEVEVTSVRFSNQRAPNGASGTWLEADIVLEARPAPGPARMVSRVRVALTAAFDLPALAGGERRLEHYRCEAECVGLEPGRANVRFYLPPEIVKRDQLHGDPKFWSVELSAGGRAIAPGRASFSSALAGAEARKSFQSRATAAAAANDGLLQPQYLTPFALLYPRETPSFVRRDPR
jgi:hypothetical protein